MKYLGVLLFSIRLLSSDGFASHRITNEFFQMEPRSNSFFINEMIQSVPNSYVFTDGRFCATKPLRICNKFRPSPTAIYLASGSNTSNNDYERTLGLLVLVTVPLSWGTYAPVVKYVYDMEVPVPGFVFSACYYMIAAITLSFLSFVSMKRNSNIELIRNNIDKISINESSYNGSNPTNLIAGFELGSYLFVGNCLQVVGLSEVPSNRAAFLVQLTTIFVPLVSAAVAGDVGAIPVSTWFSCFLAFMGVLIMSLDVPDADINAIISISNDAFHGGLSFSSSDLLIVLSALAYSMHVIRLGSYAKTTSPLKLAASKATVEAGLSLALVSALLMVGSTNISFLKEMSSEVQTYISTLNKQISSGNFSLTNSAPAIVAVLWTSWVTCAYTIYAQSFGQRRVSPTEANLIYTIQPIFSACFAWALLGEHLGLLGYSGATLIGFAVWLVASRTNY